MLHKKELSVSQLFFPPALFWGPPMAYSVTHVPGRWMSEMLVHDHSPHYLPVETLAVLVDQAT